MNRINLTEGNRTRHRQIALERKDGYRGREKHKNVYTEEGRPKKMKRGRRPVVVMPSTDPSTISSVFPSSAGQRKIDLPASWIPH